MTQAKYFFIILFLVFISVAIFNGLKKTDDADWHASSWDYAVREDDSQSVPVVFKAIEMKHQTEFVPAIIKYLALNQKHAAQAIYTLNKLGVPGTPNMFNHLLAKVPDFETPKWAPLLDEKTKALNFMSELGITLDQSASNQVKKDISWLVSKSYPNLAINMAAGAKSLGCELTVNGKQKLTSLLEEKWRHPNPYNIKVLKIKPDWEKILKSRGYKHGIAQMILICSDKSDYPMFINEIEKHQNVKKQGDFYIISSIMKSSMGDESATKDLIDNMSSKYLPFLFSVCEQLPDSVLLKAIKIRPTTYPERYRQNSILTELVKRGYKKEVDNCINQIKEYSLANLTNDPQMFYAKFDVVTHLANYDGKVYLDTLWQMFEKLPGNPILADEFNKVIVSDYYWNYEISGLYEWITLNPEKIAEVIQVTMDTPPAEERIPNDIEVHDRHYHNRNTAFIAMAYLPQATFDKYFSDLNSSYMTESAFVTGSYFKAKWAYRKNLDRFYNNCDSERPVKVMKR